jgi:hypothetical protein
MISERPAEAGDRVVPGHWEGDLLIGLQRSAIGTLVERTTRFTMLVHLPREEGFGIVPGTKNGPALAGYGAVTMKNALATTMTTLPEQLRRSLTSDRGKELSAHAAFKVEISIPVYCRPRFSTPEDGERASSLPPRSSIRSRPSTTGPEGTAALECSRVSTMRSSTLTSPTPPDSQTMGPQLGGQTTF